MSDSKPVRVKRVTSQLSNEDFLFPRIEKFSDENFVIITCLTGINGMDQVEYINRNWDTKYLHTKR